MKTKPQRYRNLIREIAKNKPYSILEIGTWNAVNACKMIETAKKYHDPKHIHYYGFDLFEDMSPSLKQKEIHAKRNVKKNEAEKRLKSTGIAYNLIVGNTHDTLPKFKYFSNIDFIYIDGGHSLSTIQSDWDNIQNLIYYNTTIIFDDYYHNRIDSGCKPLVDSLDRSKWNVNILTPIDKVNNLEISLVKVTMNIEFHNEMQQMPTNV